MSTYRLDKVFSPKSVAVVQVRPGSVRWVMRAGTVNGG